MGLLVSTEEVDSEEQSSVVDLWEIQLVREGEDRFLIRLCKGLVDGVRSLRLSGAASIPATFFTGDRILSSKRRFGSLSELILSRLDSLLLGLMMTLR